MIHSGTVQAGITEFVWDGRNTAGDRIHGGVYFCRATAGGLMLPRKMVLLMSP